MSLLSRLPGTHLPPGCPGRKTQPLPGWVCSPNSSPLPGPRKERLSWHSGTLTLLVYLGGQGLGVVGTKAPLSCPQSCMVGAGGCTERIPPQAGRWRARLGSHYAGVMCLVLHACVFLMCGGMLCMCVCSVCPHVLHACLCKPVHMHVLCACTCSFACVPLDIRVLWCA